MMYLANKVSFSSSDYVNKLTMACSSAVPFAPKLPTPGENPDYTYSYSLILIQKGPYQSQGEYLRSLLAKVFQDFGVRPT